jgi:hypothetical protein
MQTTYPENYRAHLRGHWPAVLNLAVVVLIEWWISRELNYGMTPFALLPGLDSQAAETAWSWLLSLLFVALLARYVSGRTHRLPFVTWLSMWIFTLAIVLDVIELATSLVHPDLSPHRLATPGAPTALETGIALLWDGALIWTSNIVLFTLWYWLIDGGGHVCRSENTWERRDFLFPQQQLEKPLPDYPDWHPQYPDYLYLAFCTSTALSPADTLTLSWQAKGLQILQATISLFVLALIVARAINILSSNVGS